MIKKGDGAREKRETLLTITRRN